MKAEAWMSLIPLATAVVGLVTIVRGIAQSAVAERECVRLLSAQAAALYIPSEQFLRHPDWGSEELWQVITSIDRAIVGLAPKYRRRIARGLHQPTASGCARYAAKLLSKAGVISQSHALVTR